MHFLGWKLLHKILLKYFLGGLLTICPHFSDIGFDTEQVTSHYLTQWWNVLLKNRCVIWPQSVKNNKHVQTSQIANFMGPTWGPAGSCGPQMGPMLAPWTLLPGISYHSTTVKLHSKLHPTWETKTYLPFMIMKTAGDGLVMQGDWASTAILLTISIKFVWNDPGPIYTCS